MMCPSDMRFLITGGCGFLGYHLLKHLTTYGADVCVIDVPNVNTKRIDGFANQVTLFGVDITDADAVTRIVQEVDPTHVFHLAGYGVNAAHADVATALRVNVLGGANLVCALAGTRCTRLVNIGSSAEYGVKAYKHISTIKPTTIYGSSKAAATIVMHQLAQQYELPIVTLRPFNIYGEWEEPHKLFCEIMLDILLQRELNFTPCEQRRDYVYAGDVAEAMVMAALADTGDCVLDVASGNAQPLRYYVDTLLEVAHETRAPRYGAYPYRDSEVFQHQGDPDAIRQAIGWQASTPLHEGVRRMYEWFTDHIHHYTE